MVYVYSFENMQYNSFTKLNGLEAGYDIDHHWRIARFKVSISDWS